MKTTLTALTLTTLLSATGAQAAGHGGLMAIGLSGDKTLHTIDAASAEVTATMNIIGVDRLLGLDLRPATGQLIGVTDAFEIVEIDPSTGVATVISTMDKELPIEEGAPVIVDFNPKANKLRFMSGTTNHRVDIESGAVTVDGTLAFEDQDMHACEAPAIVAAAYINSFGQPDATAMYDIDSTIVALIQQTSPNDGTLAAVGKLGFDGSDSYAFDIATDAAGKNTAWLVAMDQLHTVSLEDGSVTESWDITGANGASLRDITFMTAK
ncbi:DUF4394 domain-containing protein [Tropicibacter naphthalenivorans]|uniref:DUF4394 domain-containing protein n=1 Tax=Tropicibacter naphthalenivorans TaxID=441103 RepID=A0A0P1GGT1_9RHOB|nr:DUF4394 domain-containing protein [Tropicibacter naphthalenivorans]CUH80714.1 hypothetical protein TRN7648_03107 [Tropicibacter naphthalenivorans]SMC89475.1 protein of unknown function [Tropicibacter naphthalenivorans]